MCCIATCFSFPPFPNHNYNSAKFLNNKGRRTEEENESSCLAFSRRTRVRKKSHNRLIRSILSRS